MAALANASAAMAHGKHQEQHRHGYMRVWDDGPTPEFLTQHDTHNFAAVAACLCPCLGGGGGGGGDAAASDTPKSVAAGGDVL